MFCRQCGNKISEKAVLCSNCGTKIADNVVENATIAVSRPKKPIGLVLVVIYSALSALLMVLGGLKIFFEFRYGVPEWVLLVSVLVLAYGILIFAGCYGLWRLEKWGYNLLVTCYIISIPLIIFGAFAFIPKEEASGRVAQIVVNTGLSILILWYFFKSKTRILFSKPH